MRNLMRMDLFRLIKNKLFWIFGAITFGLTFISPIISKLLTDLLIKSFDQEDLGSQYYQELVEAATKPMELSALLKAAMGGSGLLIVLLLVSVVSYLYRDLGYGYVKNLAGQVPHHSDLVISKFALIGLHNMLLMVIAFVGSVVGTLMVRGIKADGEVLNGIWRFMVNYLLLYALSAILLLFSNGLRSKTLGIVMGVIFGVGGMNLIYLPLNLAFDRLFHVEFDVTRYVPDMLLVADSPDLLTAVIVSIVCLAVFVPLTCWLVNRSDVK